MTEREVMKAVRAAADCAGKPYPIVIIDGHQPPTLEGWSYYWTTPGGKLIRHPRAYRWAKVYHPSTYRITVGRQWVEAARTFRAGTPVEMITDAAQEMAA